MLEAADNGSKLVNDGLACCELFLFLQQLLRKQLCSDKNSANFIRNLNEVELVAQNVQMGISSVQDTSGNGYHSIPK